ncbi:MAG: SpoIIE family protein phosphatase [Caldiserica bacterium]|nr:SpoIIE family protein phosphatase [Caldisericota bacterium]
MKKNKTWVGIGLGVWLLYLVVELRQHPEALALSVIAFLVFVFLAWRLHKVEKELNYAEREKESLSLKLEDREKIAEIFEEISEMYDIFVEKIDFESLVKKTADFVGRILEADLAMVKVFIPGVVDKEVIVGDETIKIPPKIVKVLLKQRKDMFIEDVTHYPPFNLLSEQKFSKVISCPLHTKASTYGFIVGFNRERRFTNMQQFLLTNFAHHISLLVENAQLLERIKETTLKRERDGILDLRKLQEKISIEKKVEEREMELAREIQKKLLPFPLPEVPGVELHAISRASFEVGGDYFDVFPLRKGNWGIVMADVSGKGVPASLIMVMLRTALRTFPHPVKEDPLRCIKEINRYIYRETEENMFVSLIYLIFLPKEGKLRFVNAGGEMPLLYRKDAHTIEELSSEGMVVGLLPDWEYGEVKEIMLKKDDHLLLYTDGVIEAASPQGELYGEERLKSFLEKKGKLPPQVFLKELEMEVMGFSWNKPLADDLTLLAIRRK